MKRIRVLFMGYADRDIFGAQDGNAREIALRLDHERFEPYLFLRGDKPDVRFTSTGNVRLIRVPKVRKARGLCTLASVLLGGFDAIVSGKVELASTLYLKSKSVFPRRGAHLFTVEMVRPSPYASAKFEARARYLARKSDGSFAISQRIRDTSEAWCGRRLDLLYAVGVDTTVFFPEGLRLGAATSDETKTVVCCGTLYERKRPDVFLHLARRLPEHRFVWIGNGELRGVLQRTVEEEGIKNIHFLPSMPHAALAENFRKAHVFVFPSLVEGFPKVLIEAMACGIPVIAFSSYGPEAVMNGETGFVVDSSEEMEDRLRFLLSNDAERQRMGEAAARRALDFTWEAIARGYASAIEKVVVGTRG